MNDLDDQMRSLLTKLRVTPEGTTCSYDGSGGRDSEDPGGKRPPGDSETRAEYFAGKYGPPFAARGGCRDDYARELVIAEARAYLGTSPEEQARRALTAETDDERTARMLKETEGWTVEQVEQSAWRTSRSTLRMLRARNGRNPATGVRLVDRIEQMDDVAKARAQRMRAEDNLSLGQIAHRLKVPRSTVQDWVRDAA